MTPCSANRGVQSNFRRLRTDGYGLALMASDSSIGPRTRSSPALPHRRGHLNLNSVSSFGSGLLAGAIRVRLQLHTVLMTENYGTATWRYWQKILNDAGPRRTYRARPPVLVRARLLFELDGAVWIGGTATRLGFDGAIFVENTDRRCQTIGVWLSPVDVWWAGKRVT